MKPLIYLIPFLLLSCSTKTTKETTHQTWLEKTSHRWPAQEAESKTWKDEALKDEMIEFHSLVEEALTWRAQALEFAQTNADKLKKEKLSHNDIQNIHASARAYLDLRDRIMKIAYKYQESVNDKTTVNYAPNTKTSINTFKHIESNGIDDVQTRINIDPHDIEGEELLLKMRISLNAALVLYDNYMVGIYPYYYKSKKMRKLLNTDIKGEFFEFDKITANFFDIFKRNKLHQAIQLLKKDMSYKKENKFIVSDEETYLNQLAVQSPFYNYIETKYNPIINPGAVRIFINGIYDRAMFLNDVFTFTTSQVFGNTVGLVAFRKGKLTKLPKAEKASIAKTMKPLDILLEKTPFRLTDQFIPGHYGHVAIWTGTEAELKELGIWDHPSVVKHHKQIRSGRHIIEALRPGVQINTLEHFFNIDDLLVVRDQTLSLEQKQSFLIRAFEQIGKDYDFNFDVETDKKIVCSEIVYVVFHNISWPTKKTLGRHTISPDNVVSKTQEGLLTPVLMYLEGKQIKENLQEKIDELIK